VGDPGNFLGLCGDLINRSFVSCRKKENLSKDETNSEADGSVEKAKVKS
jgi:hypothetical protein